MAKVSKVFISYRRADSAPSAGRIYDRLVTQFGRENVFKDVDDIPAGVRFGTYIQESLRQCSVMLVVIGRVWLNAEATEGGRRLDDPKDWVRIEVEMAFSLGLTVIPLLVDGARMPKAAELPESLQDLAQIQSIEVRNDPDFGHSMGRVIVALDRAFASRSSPGSMGQPAAPSQAPATPPPAQVSPSTPVPVSGPVEASAAPGSETAEDAVQEEPPIQDEPPVQAEPPVKKMLPAQAKQRPLVGILIVVLVVGAFGVLIYNEALGPGGGANTSATQTASARSTLAPIVTEYPTLSSDSGPAGITSGPDGALWFTELGDGKIGRITTGGGHS